MEEEMNAFQVGSIGEISTKNTRVKMSVSPDAKGNFKIDITSEFDTVEESAKNFDLALAEATRILRKYRVSILGVPELKQE